MQFLVDILPLGSGSVDPHIFADPDPGSQNLADPTDPNPKHWILELESILNLENKDIKQSPKTYKQEHKF